MGADPAFSVVGRFTDPRLRYYKKTNGERGAARNYGSRLARGAYVNFMDSDDIAYPHHLETASRFIERRGRPRTAGKSPCR